MGSSRLTLAFPAGMLRSGKFDVESLSSEFSGGRDTHLADWLGGPVRSVHRAVCVLAAGIFAITVAAIPAQSFAATTRVVSVSPSHGLVDGQPVIIRWQGFSKNQPVALRLCERGATDVSRCAKYAVAGDRLSDVVSGYATSNSRGAGSENLTVAVTDANHGLAGAPDVRCDADHPCDIVVSDSFTSIDGAVRATVKFAPVVACPEPGLLRINGGGSDASELAIGAWGARLCQDPISVAFGYTAKNDVSGRLDYHCEKVDLAVVEYRPDYNLDNCPADTPGGKDTRRPAVRLAPVSLSPVVIAFNMRNQSATDNSRIDNITLTPQLLAEIFTGKLYNGQDRRIQALNPGVTLPANIKAIARADQAGINYTLTRFLDATARKEYRAGGRLFASGPTDFLANVNGLDLRTGGTAVAKAVLYPENDPRTTAWGYFGVMDASQALRYGLSTVTLKLSAGSTTRLVAPTASATKRALVGVTADRYGFFSLPAVPHDPGAWPMVSVGYLMPPGADSNPLDIAATATAMKFILDPAQGQSPDVLPAGYVPLPAELVASARKTLAFARPDAQIPSSTSSTSDTGYTKPSVVPTNPQTTVPASGATSDTATLASVFDRSFGGSTSGTWLWILFLGTAASAVVYLVRASNGATR